MLHSYQLAEARNACCTIRRVYSEWYKCWPTICVMVSSNSTACNERYSDDVICADDCGDFHSLLAILKLLNISYSQFLHT